MSSDDFKLGEKVQHATGKLGVIDAVYEKLSILGDEYPVVAEMARSIARDLRRLT